MSVTEQIKDTFEKRLKSNIQCALEQYQFTHTGSADEGAAYTLVDALTPPHEDDVSEGIMEVELLADHLFNYCISTLNDELKARAQPSQNVEGDLEIKASGEFVEQNGCACRFKEDACIDVCAYHIDLENTNKAHEAKIDELSNKLAEYHNASIGFSHPKQSEPVGEMSEGLRTLDWARDISLLKTEFKDEIAVQRLERLGKLIASLTAQPTAVNGELLEALYAAREYINANHFAGCANAVYYLQTVDMALTRAEAGQKVASK